VGKGIQFLLSLFLLFIILYSYKLFIYCGSYWNFGCCEHCM